MDSETPEMRRPESRLAAVQTRASLSNRTGSCYAWTLLVRRPRGDRDLRGSGWAAQYAAVSRFHSSRLVRFCCVWRPALGAQAETTRAIASPRMLADSFWFWGQGGS